MRCDRSTMTQNDIDNGRAGVPVGVAAPAEFVIFRIGQKTADAWRQGEIVMAVFRETPYSAFNFLVDLEPGKAKRCRPASRGPGLNAEITVAEYRAGNDRVNYVRKGPGIHKAGDVTLKRGVIGAEPLRVA